MATSRKIFHPKKNILIADDSALNREIISDILGEDYNFIHAEDGEQALEFLAKNTMADMLLLDMNMPRMNGMEVLKVMHKRGWTDEIPVVIISAEDDLGYIQNAYSLGAVDYIIRPFNAFLVRHRVENTLSMYSQNKRLARMVEAQIQQREKTNSTLINIFSHVVSVGSHETGSHTLRVRAITNLLLNQLVKLTDKYDLSETDISMISSVAALHDVGKIFIPTDILHKPGKLTAEEWEIMKSHTVQGDSFLSNIPIDQNDLLMVYAHQVCRHHHERYDGKGYPDGLKGDEIPIAAQVVSLADVYDALTNERSYKPAYTHEEATAMILGGECGVYNPLLLQCFAQVSDELLVNLMLNFKDQNFVNSTRALTDEAMESEELFLNDRANFLARCESTKKDFFSQCCGGIQFEYDAITRKVLYLHYYDDQGELVRLSSSAICLLAEADLHLLQKKISQLTCDKPQFSMNVIVPIQEDPRWHKLTVRAIWDGVNASYVALVGQFTDIHDAYLSAGKDLMVGEKPISGDTLVSMRNLFDVVRLVDPASCQVLRVQEDGAVTSVGQKCYELWNRNERCQNCTASQAVKSKRWITKAEVCDDRIYYVLSRYAQYGETGCVLELATCMEDPSGKDKQDIGFIPDSLSLQNYYIDTVTKAFNRSYLENFLPQLEKAKAVAMIDIDSFKGINDTYGHLAGDAALQHVVSAIRSCLRENDIPIRYGGDEFLLIFPKIYEKHFLEILENISQRVRQIVIEEHPTIKLSVSVGGAYGIKPLYKAIDAADKAMYRDKFKVKG